MRTATIGILAAAGTMLFGQSPSQLKLPGAIGRITNGGGIAPAPANDIMTRYGSRREAAIAALKAGNEAATIVRAPQRALGLFLLSARRDPGFAAALYDLGVMCAREERWDDAINFYREADLRDTSADMARLTQAEVARVQLIASLESNRDGQRKRQFDITFAGLVAKRSNPNAALENALQLAKTDAGRWEAAALIGLLQAELGKYGESAVALDAAGRIAPPERRKALAAAAELARREATFEDLVRTGNENWDKQQYDAAGKAYANAWETSPARDAVGMQAATAFLMGDQVPLGVQVLARLRQSGGRDTAAKAVAMLKELGAVSDDARQQTQADSGGNRPEALADIAERVRGALGDLTSPEMLLVSKEGPALLRDETRFIAVPDEELTGNASDLLLMSTQSVFQIYRKAVSPNQPSGGGPADVPAVSSNPGDSAPVPVPEAAQPAAPGHPQKFDTRPADPAAPGRAGAAPSSGGVTTVASTPEGARVILDDVPERVCTAPCQIDLAPGRHILKATRTGYRDLQTIFEVPGNRTASVALPLDPKRGTILVQTEIPGAEILVDGQKSNKITPADLTMNEGPHRIEVIVGAKVNATDLNVKDYDLLRLGF
jgi:tetratricopeptide (TPR) repeat protein